MEEQTGPFRTLVVEIAHGSANGLELLGVGIIVVAAVTSSVNLVVNGLKSGLKKEIFQVYRRMLARGILLGLEPLVAADIINTVAIELTIRSAVVLAIVVLIRTLLSFTIELEITGRWPWQSRSEE